MAIRENGSLWVWGNNANGRLGSGVPDGGNRTRPIQLGSVMPPLW